MVLVDTNKRSGFFKNTTEQGKSILKRGYSSLSNSNKEQSNDNIFLEMKRQQRKSSLIQVEDIDKMDKMVDNNDYYEEEENNDNNEL